MTEVTVLRFSDYGLASRNPSEPGIWAFTINRQNGNLTESSASPYDSTVNFEAIVVDQSDKYVYAFAAGQIYAYSIGSGGALTAVAGSPFGTCTGGAHLTSPASGKFLFGASCGNVFD